MAFPFQEYICEYAISNQLFMWKNIDAMWLDFFDDPSNTWLWMKIDGFNPFVQFSSHYNFFPIVFVKYKLSLLIHGPRQLGNYLDVYLYNKQTKIFKV